MDNNNNTRIVLRRRSASAMKLFYTAIFAFAAYHVYRSLRLPSKEDFVTDMASYFPNTQAEEFGFLYYVVVGFAVLTLVHLARIYITVEMLEDRFTRVHGDTVARLGTWGGRFEQFARITVIAVVSMKVVPPESKIWTAVFHWLNVAPDFQIARVAIYLIALYAALLIWDIILLIFGKYSWESPWDVFQNCFSKSYIITSFVGLVMAALLLMVSPGGVDSAQYILPLGTVLAVTCLLFLIAFGFDVVPHAWDYLTHLGRILADLLWPYYGDACLYTECPTHCGRNDCAVNKKVN